MTLIIFVVLFFAMILLGSPIIIAMGFTAVAWLIQSDIPVLVMAQKIFTQTDSFALLAVPFFMFAGQLMEKTGITEKILGFANKCVGHIRGGFGCAVELAGIIMAGISGSANADAAALASLTLPGLKKQGYDEGISVSIVASAGVLGPIIPPSVFVVLYATAANMNVGQLLMSGIMPGVVCGFGFMVICYIYACRHGLPTSPFPGFKAIGHSFIRALGALFMPLIIIGGILSGVFTATEAGVIACVYGLGYGMVQKKLTVEMLTSSLRDAVLNSVAPLGIMAMSSIFGYMLSRERLPAIVSDFCANNIGNPHVFLFFVVLLAVFAGCFIDASATMLMMIPILMPIAANYGISALDFSIVFTLALMTAGITPPVGQLLFIVASYENIPLNKVVKKIPPFIFVMFAVCIIEIFFPAFATWIPALMYK